MRFTDGYILSRGFIKILSEMYDGLHPLDLTKKGTVRDAMRWVDEVVKARDSLRKATVFHTGVPIDLIMLNEISVSDILRVVSYFLRRHGKKDLVLSVTHRPYPERDFLEELAFEKVKAIRRLVGLPKLDSEKLRYLSGRYN